MNTLVVDSSVIIKWLNSDQEENVEIADRILEDVKEGKIDVIAPELAKYEVGNVLLLGKKLSPEHAEETLKQFYLLPINFFKDSKKLSIKTFNLASELEITYYDASFISLAQQENTVLVTDNVKHQGKASNIKVIALKDY